MAERRTLHTQDTCAAGTVHPTHDICTFTIPCTLIVLAMHAYVYVSILTRKYMLIRDSVQTEQISIPCQLGPKMVTRRYNQLAE